MLSLDRTTFGCWQGVNVFPMGKKGTVHVETKCVRPKGLITLAFLPDILFSYMEVISPGEHFHM